MDHWKLIFCLQGLVMNLATAEWLISLTWLTVLAFSINTILYVLITFSLFLSLLYLFFSFPHAHLTLPTTPVSVTSLLSVTLLVNCKWNFKFSCIGVRLTNVSCGLCVCGLVIYNVCWCCVTTACRRCSYYTACINTSFAYYNTVKEAIAIVPQLKQSQQSVGPKYLHYKLYF